MGQNKQKVFPYITPALKIELNLHVLLFRHIKSYKNTMPPVKTNMQKI